MTENNLKNMIENHELDNLMTNGEELERLKSSRTTEQVLGILKKYNYTETKEVFERELLEILQSIKLNEEEMKNVSGGKSKTTQYLSAVMGGLVTLNSAGFMSAKVVTEKQKHNEKYSVGSLLNNVDTKTVKHIGIGAVGIGLLWAIKEIVTSRTQNKTFTPTEGTQNITLTLTEEQQKIYDNTKKLSEMILKYVRNYIDKNEPMPDKKLNTADPEHQKILNLIGEIRTDWLTMYDNIDGVPISPEKKQKVIANQKEKVYVDDVYSVELDEDAVEDLFYGLPVGKTWVCEECLPFFPKDSTDKEMTFLSLLFKLEDTYRTVFEKLKKEIEGPGDKE